jgi:predicted secreted protein
VERSGRVVVLAHCLLNVNTKVRGLAIYPAVHPMVPDLLAGDVGVLQLPCPEVAFLGMSRWGMTREQYDVPAYRRHCAALLEPTVDTLEALARDGCAIAGVWGLDGSPSCGVEQTCAGYAGGDMDRLTGPPEWSNVSGEGVYMAVLRSLLVERGLDVPFSAVPEAG